MELQRDKWSRWLLERRFAGDPQRVQAVLTSLYSIRDKVLDYANLSEDKILLDVGCGDGLIAFGALERVKTGRVICCDISQDLLNHAQAIARDLQVLERCQFLHASADDLSALADASVDVVTTRSVLIYVTAKQQAFKEFYRVLRPQGRLSLFEPINRFAAPAPPHRFGWYNVTPVLEIAQKVKAVYQRLQPPETDPMLNFDERDLLAMAETAGFLAIYLDLEAEITPPAKEQWEVYLRTPGNPTIPTLEEVMQEVLTPEETEQFVSHLRPLVEAGEGVKKEAFAYLWAVKQ